VEQVEEFVYYDPVKKLKFSFDPHTLEAKVEEENVDWESQYLASPIVQLRDEIVKAMNSYLSRQYRKGTSEFGVYASGDGSELRVEISCHNLNFKSFWGGEWLSSWLIDTNSGHIKGSVKVQNHYFEQGNIQFNMNKEFPSAKLSAQTGRAVVDFIAKNETNVRIIKYQHLCAIVSGGTGGHVHGGFGEAPEGHEENNANHASQVRLEPPEPPLINISTL
jgi:F-actin capping protein alpha subunit